MKRISYIAAFALGLFGAGAHAASWITDYSAALKQAESEQKLVLIDFTGSDWCGWCIKLKAEVFDTPEFKRFADANLVLLEVDFPRRKALSAEQKAANFKLQSKYPVQGYPTIVIADKTGRALGITGYTPGGPSAFIAGLKQIPNTTWKEAPKTSKPKTSAAAESPSPSELWAGIKTGSKHYDDLKLTGLSGAASRRLALINNQTFSAGETARVKLKNSEVKVICKEIREKSVIVQVDGANDTKELVLEN